jgi:hypothetical protein
VAPKGWTLLPSALPNLVFVALALFVTTAIRSPATFIAVAIALLPLPSLSPATLIVVSIALAALALALFVNLQPCCCRHCSYVAIAIIIALSGCCCLPAD